MPSPSTPGMKSMRGPMTLNGRTIVKREPAVLRRAPRSPARAAAWRRRRSSARAAPARGRARSRPRPCVRIGAAARVERRPPVHLAGREVHEPAAARRAQLHDRQQIGEARVDHVERPGVVEGRVAERGQRHHHVGARGQLVEQPGRRRCPPRSDARAGRPASSLSSVAIDGVDLHARTARPARGTRCEPTKPPAPSTAMRGVGQRGQGAGRRDGAEAWHGPGHASCARSRSPARDEDVGPAIVA